MHTLTAMMYKDVPFDMTVCLPHHGSLLLNSQILLSLFKGILYTKFCKDCCVQCAMIGVILKDWSI